MKKIVRKFLDFFYVRRCIVCGKGIKVNEDICICDKCRIEIRRFGYNVTTDGSEVVSPLPYTGNIRRAMWRFKFNNKKYLGRTFGELLYRRLKMTPWIDDVDYIVCVPMCGRNRLYNQSAVIAQEVAERLNIPFCENALIKVKNNRPFYRLTYKERLNLVKGAYDVGEDLSFAGKNVLLVDDIRTTGITLDECKRVLVKNGASKVFCTTVCFGVPKNMNK